MIFSVGRKGHLLESGICILANEILATWVSRTGLVRPQVGQVGKRGAQDGGLVEEEGLFFNDNGDNDNQISCIFSWAIYRVLTGHSYFQIST